MADKILVLRIGDKSLRLAEQTHSYDDGSLGWQLLVEPKLLEEFIDENAHEVGRGTTHVEEVEDRDGEITDLRLQMERMTERFDNAMQNVHTLIAAVTRLEAAVGYKHLEEQYPKREQMATRQDDEALLRTAKAGVQPVLPPQTKPMHPWEGPRVHDLTGRFPRLNVIIPGNDKVSEIVKASRAKVDYEAAQVKAAAQPDRTIEDAVAEAERAVDETEKPRGFCGLCGEQTKTSICAECALLITFGQARYIREWLERCEQIALKAGITFDDQERARLNTIIGVNEAERKLKLQLSEGMTRHIVVPGDGNIRAYVNKEQLKNPLHEPSEPYAPGTGSEETDDDRDSTEGMPF